MFPVHRVSAPPSSPLTLSRLAFRAATATLAFIAFVLLLASPAWSADGDPVTPTTGTVLTMSLATWAVLQGTVIPILVGILTKVNAPDPIKVLINLLLNALGGLVAVVVVSDGVATLSLNAIVAAGLGFVASIASHYGFWKPLGVTGSNPSTNRLAPARGLG